MRKRTKLLALSSLAFTFNVSAEQCDFKAFFGQINNIKQNQSFSEYFSPLILHNFRLAKYREYNAIDLLQHKIHGEDDPDFGKTLKQIMMGHIIRITQEKGLINELNIASVSAAADRYKNNIRSLSHLDDYNFFNQYLTNSFRDSTFHYDSFKESIISLSNQAAKRLGTSCSYILTTNNGRVDFPKEITLEIDNGVIVSPSLLFSMFDYQASAYTVEKQSEINFAAIPEELYPQGVKWWRLNGTNQ
ncbi:hypothetical protein VSA01S_32090 [Vibrio sagamiensis NBRC 104589]|uniref:Uncharacterized protein n=2 Tax=Vibrio sagamiensis TaxID=512650 RepID=A0A511QIT7_9VIBR|nr:hypothetical protein VSA01S_32090 [Vibrio sagamiensis NBRC 104589]